MDTTLLERGGIDYAHGVERFLGDSALYEEVLAEFLKEDALDRAQAAYDSHDLDALFAVVHEVKGSSGNTDMHDLYLASAELADLLRPRAVRTPQDADVTRLFDAFADAYRRAVSAIRDASADEGA